MSNICKICHFVLSTASNARRHERAVHGMGVNKYPCLICDKRTYTRSDLLQRHMRYAHPNVRSVVVLPPRDERQGIPGDVAGNKEELETDSNPGSNAWSNDISLTDIPGSEDENSSSQSAASSDDGGTSSNSQRISDPPDELHVQYVSPREVISGGHVVYVCPFLMENGNICGALYHELRDLSFHLEQHFRS